VRCMNRNQQPRPLPVLWRACGSLVSTGQDWSATDLSSYRTTPPCDASKLSPYNQSGKSYPLQRVHALTEHVRPHSKYIGFPVGGFLQVAVSEAPLPEHANPRCFAGRSRYSTKIYGD
jgi:hypothetical protein